MRFDSIRAHAMGPFKTEVSVDLSAIEGKLVAVVGDNGAGKSTLLELLAGAMHRTCPTRGSLVDLATARDSFVEVQCVNGSRWTLLHMLDVVSGKSEALVLDANGSPALADTKVTGFDQWASKTLPPPNVLLASTFAAQGSGGFLEMKASERKALLLKILGIDRLERLAADARERARGSKAELDIVAARLQDARAAAVNPEEAAKALQHFEQCVVLRQQELEEANARLAGYEVKAERVRVLMSAEQDRVRRLDAARAHLESVRTRIADLDGRIANNRGVLARTDEINVAVERRAAIDSRVSVISNQTARLDAAIQLAVGQRDAAYASGVKITARLQSAKDREKEANQRLARRDEIMAKAAEVAQLRDDIVGLEGAVASVSEQIDTLYGKRADTAQEQVKNLRDTLYDVGSRALSDADDARSSFALAEALRWVGRSAHTTVARHDESVHQAALLPGALKQARDLSASYAAELQRTRKTLTDAEKVASLAPLLDTAEKDRAAAIADGQAAREEGDAAIEAYHEASKRVAAAQQEREAFARELAALAAEHTSLTPTAQLFERLASAKARLDVLEPEREGAMRDTADMVGEIERLDAETPTELPEMPDVVRARAEANGAQYAVATAVATVETAERTLTNAIEAAKRIAELQQQADVLGEDLADWTRLANDLGKDGLIAAEVDCVGPTLTDMVNDLLHTCVGPRWTVTFETQRSSVDGKKQIEGCDVKVLDTVAGRDANAETLSGGEKVLVGEAISLALSMLGCQRSGFEGCSLIRDESGAALSPANARAYVAILRRAADIVGASQILLVSHSPEVQELCDARIEIKDGSVRVAA